MKFTTLSRRTAAAGAASALVAGALVGATTTAAQAAPVSNVYVCGVDGVAGPWDVQVVSDVVGIDGLPGSWNAGQAAPGGLAVENTFTIPSEARAAMESFLIEDLAFPDFAGGVGTSSIPVAGMTAKVSEMTQNVDGSYSFDSNGTTVGFEFPAAGTHDVVAPEAFSMQVTVGGDPATVPCAVKEGTTNGAYRSLEVTKNTSTSKASSNSPVANGNVAKVRAKVSAPNEVPTGKVIFKKGKRKLGTANLNAKGVAVLKTKALKVGKSKVTTIYKGDDYTEGSKASTVVKVTR